MNRDLVIKQLSKFNISEVVKQKLIDYFELISKEYDMSIAEYEDYNKSLDFKDNLIYVINMVNKLLSITSDLDKQLEIISKSIEYKLTYFTDRMSKKEYEELMEAKEKALKEVICQLNINSNIKINESEAITRELYGSTLEKESYKNYNNYYNDLIRNQYYNDNKLIKNNL